MSFPATVEASIGLAAGASRVLPLKARQCSSGEREETVASASVFLSPSPFAEVGGSSYVAASASGARAESAAA